MSVVLFYDDGGAPPPPGEIGEGLSLIESLLLHDRPVAWWGLDELTETTDDSENGYDLTPIGAPAAAASLHTRGDDGANFGSRDFDGVDDAYEVLGTLTAPRSFPEFPSFLPKFSLVDATPGATNAVPRTPGGTEVGDLMIAFLVHSTQTASISSTPSGWTQIGSTLNFGQGAFAVFRKIAESADVPTTFHTWVWNTPGSLTSTIVTCSNFDTAVAGGVFDSGIQATTSFTAHATTTETHPDVSVQLVAFAGDFAGDFVPEPGGTVLEQIQESTGHAPLVPGLLIVAYEQQEAGSGFRYCHTSPDTTTLGAALITFGAADEVTNDALDTITENITIGCLINPDSFATASKTIVRKRGAWGLECVLTTGVLRFLYFDGGGTARSVDGPAVSTGQTSRVWVVDDGTNVHFYVNGVKTSVARVGAAGYSSTAFRVVIGARYDETTGVLGNFFDGRIDELAIFPVALNDQMVQAHETAATAGTFGEFLQADKTGRYPRAKVEIAPDSNATDACHIFDDVSEVARQGDELVVTRGRNFEQDRMTAGTMSLVLGNRDRAFDDLRPRRVVRFRAQAAVDGPVFPIFFGYTDAPEFERRGFGADSVVRLVATDTFKALAVSTIREEFPRGVELAGARIAAVLADVSGLKSSLDEGRHELAAAEDLAGTTRLEHCLAAAESDGGIFFADAIGRLVFQDAHHRGLNSRDVQATYGWPGTSATFRCQGFHPIVDESRLFTAAEVTPATGEVQRVVNETAADEFFELTRQLATLHEHELDALALAHHIVNRYSIPLERVPSLVLQPVADPDNAVMWATVLAHEFSDRIKTIEEPLGGGEVEREHFIEGITHVVSGNSWDVSFSLSPTELEGSYFIIGMSALGDPAAVIGY